MAKNSDVKIKITADDKDVKKKLNDVEESAQDAADGVNDLGDAGKNAGKGLDVADVAAGSLAAQGLSALIGAVGNALQSLISLADETREYREDMNRLDAAFTSSGHSSEAASKAYEAMYQRLGESDRAVEAVNHLAQLTDNEKELEQWTTITSGVMATFGDSLPIEGLTEAANETAKVGKVTGPLADALNWAGKSEDEFNKQLEACNSEQERSTLITETLSGMYSDAAESYDKANESIYGARDATAAMEAAQANLGKAIEPLTTAWTNLKAQALEAIQPVIEKIVGWLQKVQAWAEENPEKMEIVKGAIIGLAAGFGALMIISSVVQAFSVLSAILAVNPFTLIIAAIAALVAAFIYLWNNCEEFREFWINLWEGIKEIAGAVAAWFSQAWSDTIEWLKGAWSSITEFFSSTWEGIKEIYSAVNGWFTQIFTDAWNGIKTAWSAVTNFFSDIWNGIVEIFIIVATWFGEKFASAKKAVTVVWDTIKGYFSDIWNGIKSVFNAIGSWFSDKFQDAKDGITSIFDTVGEYFEGVWKDIIGVFANAFKVGEDIVQGIKDGISAAWTGIVEWFEGLWNSLFGGRNVDVNVNGKGGGVDGSNKNGLDYVPFDGYISELHKGERVLTRQENQEYNSLLQMARNAVGSQRARVNGSVVSTSDGGITEIARAIGIQSAGINSLAGEYRRGGENKQPIILAIDGREFGRAVVETGNKEINRTGIPLALGGVY